MATKSKSHFTNTTRAERSRQHWRSLLLRVLKARGFSVGEQMRALINSCVDEGQLVRWVIRASTAATTTEIFAESASATAPASTSAGSSAGNWAAVIARLP